MVIGYDKIKITLFYYSNSFNSYSNSFNSYLKIILIVLKYSKSFLKLRTFAYCDKVDF